MNTDQDYEPGHLCLKHEAIPTYALIKGRVAAVSCLGCILQPSQVLSIAYVCPSTAVLGKSTNSHKCVIKVCLSVQHQAKTSQAASLLGAPAMIA